MGGMPEVSVLLSKAISSEAFTRSEHNRTGITLWKGVTLEKMLWFCSVLWAIDLRHLWRREKKYWGYFIKRYIIKHVQVWFLHFGTWPSFLIQNQLVKLFRWSCAPFEAWCLHTMLHCILCFTKATHFIHQESQQVVYVGTRFAVPCSPGCPQL